MKKVQADIRKKTFEKVYLLYGSDSYLRQNLKNALRRAIAGTDEMNVLILQEKEAEPQKIIEAAETLPFFAEKRLIIVENSGFFKRDMGDFADYLERIPETACVIFTEETVDKRGRLFKKLEKAGYAADCSSLDEEELKRQSARRLQREGKQISERNMDYFLSLTDSSTGNVSLELEKLICYLGDREVVSEEDITAITTRQVSGRLYEMIDAIGLRDQKRALELYYDLLMTKEPPVRILANIGFQMLNILKASEMQAKGWKKKQMMEQTGWRNWQADKYLRQCRQFTKEKLMWCLQQSAELQEAFRSGLMDDTLAVELLIVSLTAKDES